LFLCQLRLLLLLTSTLRRSLLHRLLSGGRRREIDIEFVHLIAHRGLELRRVYDLAIFGDGDIELSRRNSNAEKLTFIIGFQRVLAAGLSIFELNDCARHATAGILYVPLHGSRLCQRADRADQQKNQSYRACFEFHGTPLIKSELMKTLIA